MVPPLVLFSFRLRHAKCFYFFPPLLAVFCEPHDVRPSEVGQEKSNSPQKCWHQTKKIVLKEKKEKKKKILIIFCIYFLLLGIISW
jgi:predicted nucleic acid-binding Zn ribbon protein